MSLMLIFLRQLEEIGRRGLFTVLMACSPRARRVTPSALLRKPLRVLFIAEDAVGDSILTLPAIRAVAESHPGTVVDVATWGGVGELFSHAPYVRRVILFPRYDRSRVSAALIIRRHGPYDAVIDTMVLRRHVRSRSFAMMLASGARYWIGEGDRGSDYVLNVAARRPDIETPHLDRMLALAAPFNDAHQRRPLLRVDEHERHRATKVWGAGKHRKVLINISTNGPERRWHLSRYAEITAYLHRRAPGARVLVVAMAHDRDNAETVAASGGAGAGVVIPTMPELLALVESADIVVSPDTAVCHLASAFKRPLVSIHNYGNEKWHPFDTPGVRVIGPARESFDEIGAPRVMQAIDRVLVALEVEREIQTAMDFDPSRYVANGNGNGNGNGQSRALHVGADSVAG
jgi:heptosyltransferase-2